MKKHKNSNSKPRFKTLHKKYTARVVKHAKNLSGSTRDFVASNSKLTRKEPDKEFEQAIQTIPRITNETVAEHREEVLSSARKYIYPLKHSTHRIVAISVYLFISVVIIFFAYCILALYKFQSTSGFIYGVTQVIPFPIANEGGKFISYESYLFELRHYIHYYQTQQKVNFSDSSGQRQLNQFKQQALNEVIDDAYIKQLAQQNDVSVSSDQLNNEIQLLQQQNRLGSSNQVFAAVLKEFWGWSVNDFKRELQQQMLAQAVVSKMDVQAHQRAEFVLQQLESGGNFATLAKQYSDDTSTSTNGGAYGFEIDKNNRDVSPQVINALFNLKVGQYSNVIDTGQGLEIVELTSQTGNQVEASHIFIAYKSIDYYIQPLKTKNKPSVYISVK